MTTPQDSYTVHCYPITRIEVAYQFLQLKELTNHLGWLSKKTRYRALINEGNQERRLDFGKVL